MHKCFRSPHNVGNTAAGCEAGAPLPEFPAGIYLRELIVRFLKLERCKNRTNSPPTYSGYTGAIRLARRGLAAKAGDPRFRW